MRVPRAVGPIALVVAIVILGGVIQARKAERDIPGKVSLRYMAWGNPEQLAVEQKLVDLFNRDNPDIHVSLFMTPGTGYSQKAILMLASGTAPDVMRIDHYQFPSLVGKRYFADLTDLAAHDPGYRASDFFPTSLDECVYKGHLYALNVLGGGELVYYNKTLIQKAGLADPYALYERGGWTWERFRQYAIKLSTRGRDGSAKTFGTIVSMNLPAVAMAVWSFGGDFLNSDHSRCLLASPGATEGYQFLADLIWKDHAAPTPAEQANSAFAFESGKLGMNFDFMGMSPRYRTLIKSFDWDVCPPPVGKCKTANILKGNQLVAAANCKHLSEAWRFIRFMTSAPTEQLVCGALRRAFPSRKSVAYSTQYLSSDGPPRNVKAFLDTVQHGRALPIDDRWADWTQVLNSEAEQLYLGEIRDARVVMRGAAAKVDAVLAEPAGF